MLMKQLHCARVFAVVAALVWAGVAGCASDPRLTAGRARSPSNEVRSLLGPVLNPPDLAPDRRAALEADLAAAKAALDAAPESEEAHIWFGRRLAYLYRYPEAIDAFSAGLRVHPTSYRLLRHRGHRFITVRRFVDAQRDLARAAQLAEGTADAVEPDGAPNPAGIPRSTDHTNIWYHLALVLYLRGDFASAERSWARCVELSRINDDMLVASTYWHYLTLRRLGRAEAARAALETIRQDMEILENHTYHTLLLDFKQHGLPIARAPMPAGIDMATWRYGAAMADLLDGRRHAAVRGLREVLAGGTWPAFGYIAAEAELARMRREAGAGYAP
jgi:tetratricopeptide (TPR) repeat protein